MPGKAQGGLGVMLVSEGPPVYPPKPAGEKVLGRGRSCGSGCQRPWESLGGHSQAVAGENPSWSCSSSCEGQLMSS